MNGHLKRGIGEKVMRVLEVVELGECLVTCRIWLDEITSMYIDTDGDQ
jgi:hypothetical protein